MTKRRRSTDTGRPCRRCHDAALRLKHGGEKWVVGRFLLNALARAHLG
jgi:hypothetical protein